MGLLELGDIRVFRIDFPLQFLNLLVFDEGDDQSDDGPAENPPDGAGIRGLCNIRLPFLDLVFRFFHFVFEDPFLVDDFFRRRLVVLIQDLGLVLIDIGRIAEYLSFHKPGL